jgi:hypothetical protein
VDVILAMSLGLKQQEVSRIIPEKKTMVEKITIAKYLF